MFQMGGQFANICNWTKFSSIAQFSSCIVGWTYDMIKSLEFTVASFVAHIRAFALSTVGAPRRFLSRDPHVRFPVHMSPIVC